MPAQSLVNTMLVLCIAILWTTQLLPAVSAAEQPREVIPAANPLTRAPFDELLSKLPKAGTEFEWDDAAKTWIESPASQEVRDRLLAGNLTDEQIVSALIKSRAVGIRARWPDDRPLAVALTAPAWIGGSMASIEVKPTFAGSVAARINSSLGGCGLANDFERSRGYFMEVGKPPSNVVAVTFDVKLDAHNREPKHGARKWHGHISYPIQVVHGLSPSIDAITDPAFTDALRQATSVNIGMNQGQPPRTAIWIELRRTEKLEPFLAKHACRANVEILTAKGVVYSGTVDFRHDCRLPSYVAHYVDKIPDTILRDPQFVAGARLRVTGSRDLSFADLRRDSCWAGSFEAPLAEFVRKKD